MHNMQDTTRNMSKAGSGIRLTWPEIWLASGFEWLNQKQAGVRINWAKKKVQKIPKFSGPPPENTSLT